MKRLCSNCHKRPPLFRVRGGRVKADHDHNLCMQCVRAEKNRLRVANSSRLLNEVPNEMASHLPHSR